MPHIVWCGHDTVELPGEIIPELGHTLIDTSADTSGYPLAYLTVHDLGRGAYLEYRLGPAYYVAAHVADKVPDPPEPGADTTAQTIDDLATGIVEPLARTGYSTKYGTTDTTHHTGYATDTT